jgi:guanylate cyclase
MLPESDSRIAGGTLTDLEHIVSVHLSHQAKLMDTLLSTLVAEHCNYFQSLLIGACVSGILLSILFFLGVLSFGRAFASIHESIIILTKRLPPHALAANPDLLDYVMGREIVAESQGMAHEQGVLHLAEDGILCVNRNRELEFMNPAITTMLGHSPEQKLGCKVVSLFSEESQARIETILDVIESDPLETNVICPTQGGGELTCHVVGFWINREKGSERCILVLSDVTALEAAKIVADEARAVAERLKNAVLPAEIEERMTAGEPAFQVPVATVMSLALSQFNVDHSTPQEIMPKLASVFGAFEKRMADFPGLTRVRIFGESLLCVAGIFGEQPTKAADAVVSFAQNCIEILEDINVKNYGQDTVQIGIHTGGPLICGVIDGGYGFDIFGEPVARAMVMQRTAPPNTLQMSEATYAHIQPVPLGMTKRTVKTGGKEYVTHLLRAAGSSSNSI